MKRIAVLAAAIAIGCAVFAIPSVAHAQPVTGPLSFNSMTPADGASITSGAALTFEMSSSAGYVNGPSVEVSTQPTLGQDGTLADDFRVSIAVLFRSDAFPNLYRGEDYSSSSGWASRPGVYYWQAHSSEGGTIDPSTGEYKPAVGPVRKIIVTAPAPAAPGPAAPARRLGVNEGYSVVRQGLKRKFRSRYTRGRKRRATYTRLSATTIRYRVSWVKGHSKYSGSVKVHENANDYTYWVSVRRR